MDEAFLSPVISSEVEEAKAERGSCAVAPLVDIALVRACTVSLGRWSGRHLGGCTIHVSDVRTIRTVHVHVVFEIPLQVAGTEEAWKPVCDIYR